MSKEIDKNWGEQNTSDRSARRLKKQRPPLSTKPALSHNSPPLSPPSSYEPAPGFQPCPLPAWAPATPATPVWLVQLPPDVS